MTMEIAQYLPQKRFNKVKTWLLGGVTALLLTTLNAAEQATGPVNIRPDSPSSYTVVQGDTLWDIAGRFLEQPWMWPQVWQVNPQIQNPDLIYPGDLITLSYVDGQPVLSVSRPGEGGGANQVTTTSTLPPSVDGIRTEKRSPSIRRESLLSPIPAIPLENIEALLSQNRVVTEEMFEAAPYLLGEVDGRNVFGEGQVVYARGNWNNSITRYDIVRQGREFEDPDTGDTLGMEAILIGHVTVTGISGERAVLHIDSSELEAKAGDRLLERTGSELDSNFLPQPPNFAVDAAIVTVGTGRMIGGQYDTLVLNQGSNIGLAPGHLLSVQQSTDTMRDIYGKHSIWDRVRNAFGGEAGHPIEFPGEKIGSVLIYQVYDNASLGYVLNSTEDISTQDRLVTP
jgi:LysM domain